MRSENQSPVAAFPGFRCGACMTPLDQLRLPPAHEFDRLMQAAKPVAEADRDALLKDIAAAWTRLAASDHQANLPRRYDVVNQRRTR